MRIMFMGTPDFAKECLRRIHESNEEIVAVVTTPDKPRGRGMTLTPSPVKSYALENGLPVYQPQTLKNGAFADVLEETKPELIVVVAYGRILPKYVLEYAKFGCINAHASILPKYRGAAPIQRAIIDGEAKTGVSVMQMDEGLDTGDVILTNEVEITLDDNFETVHDKLIVAGSEGLLTAIEQFKNGTVSRARQGEGFTYAEKITKEDCLIDFSRSSRAVHDQIRGLSPIPLSYTKTPDGRLLKVVKAHMVEDFSDKEAGEVISLNKTVVVKCGEGAIALDIIVPEGKGKMDASAYINGRKLSIGEKLG